MSVSLKAFQAAVEENDHRAVRQKLFLARDVGFVAHLLRSPLCNNGLTAALLSARLGHEHILCEIVQFRPSCLVEDRSYGQEDILMMLASSNSCWSLQRVLELSPDMLRHRDDAGRSAVFHAASHGALEALAILFEACKGLPTNLITAIRHDFIMGAAVSGDFRKVAALRPSWALPANNYPFFDRALYSCVLRREVTYVRNFICCITTGDISFTAQWETMLAAAQVAAVHNCAPMCAVLLEYSRCITFPGDGGETAPTCGSLLLATMVAAAARCGHLRLLQGLITLAPLGHSRTTMLLTAFKSACVRGEEASVEALLDCGVLARAGSYSQLQYSEWSPTALRLVAKYVSQQGPEERDNHRFLAVQVLGAACKLHMPDVSTMLTAAFPFLSQTRQMVRHKHPTLISPSTSPSDE